MTPQSLVDRFPAGETIELVKMDIEGAEEELFRADLSEEELFRADLSWLDRVETLAVVLHADRVDWRGIMATLARLGFSHHQIAAGSKYLGLADMMAAFRRC